MSQAINESRELGRLLIKYWVRWAVPMVLVGLGATAYAVIAPKTWQASQALIVRNEASGSADLAPGKFRGPEDLKAVEDTISELAHSRVVLAGALAEVGPPPGTVAGPVWPTEKDIDRLQSVVKVVPPKGLEFGTTEVFYLELRDSSAARVVQLASAVAKQLQARTNELRNSKAESMIAELTRAVQVARNDLQTSTVALTALEKEVGRDLPELRSLLDSNSSDTSLRRTVSEIENELRQVRSALKTNKELLGILQEAAAEPWKLVGAPSRLLDSQPGLRRLKDGLVDAQLTSARLQGKDSAQHPEVLAALNAEKQIAERLHDEVLVAVRSLTADVRMDSERLALLETQRDQSAARMNRVAGMRATYSNLLNETNNRSKLLERAEQSLSEARASAASTHSACLLSMLDKPDAGAGPVSPGTATVILGGLVAGLLIGIGVVFLTAPASAGEAANGLGDCIPYPQAAPAGSLALTRQGANAHYGTVASGGTVAPLRTHRDVWSETPIDCGQRMTLKQALLHLEAAGVLSRS